MKDELISYETAVLAKEKGFVEKCLCFYFKDGEFRENSLTGTNGYYGDDYCFSYDEFLENWNDKFVTKKNGDRCFGCNNNSLYFETFSAPTQSLMQRWLREVHNIHFKNFHPKIEDFGIDIIGYFPPSIYYDGKTTPLNNNYYKTYEEALEMGLQEALKLIK